MERIKNIMAGANSFMAIGQALKAQGIKYTFSIEAPMPPLYMITIEGKNWYIVNEKYADDGSYVVNGMGLTQ